MPQQTLEIDPRREAEYKTWSNEGIQAEQKPYL